MRLLAIFLAISASVYFLTGLSGKHSKKRRLRFALATYTILFLSMLVVVLFRGDRP